MIERRAATLKCSFPYISGLLSFREGLALLGRFFVKKDFFGRLSPRLFIFDNILQSCPVLRSYCFNLRILISSSLGIWLKHKV
ncbi:MAG: endonuclease V [Actinobacteria bacterium]|nr:endonuclease V [Actinomycetota bacterium]